MRWGCSAVGGALRWEVQCGATVLCARRHGAMRRDSPLVDASAPYFDAFAAALAACFVARTLASDSGSMMSATER